MVRADEMPRPISAGAQHGGGLANLSFRGAGVDHLTAAEIDANVARGIRLSGEDKDVSSLNRAHVGEAREAGG